MCQRHGGASASTAGQSGAQGTVRLLRAWVKPLPLGQGARTSFWAPNPPWRKRRRTLVPAALARAKPQHTRRPPPQRHGGASASTAGQSGAQGTVRLLRTWVKPLPLGQGARTSFWAPNPPWRKRRHTLVPAACCARETTAHATATTAAPRRSQRQHGGAERSPRYRLLA